MLGLGSGEIVWCPRAADYQYASIADRVNCAVAVPSSGKRKSGGSAKGKEFLGFGPPGAVGGQPTVSETNRNRMGTIVGTEFQVNGSQHVLDSLLSDLKVARNVCVRVPIRYQLEQTQFSGGERHPPAYLTNFVSIRVSG